MSKTKIPTTPTSPLQTAEMSALGHEQTTRHVHIMSVIPLKADIHQREWHVRLVPEADIAQQEAVAAGQVTPYKFSGPVKAMGRCYAGLIVASAADLASGGQWDGCRRQETPWSYVGRPLDGGALFSDGQPIFGPSKTIRGIVVSLLATSICAAAMGLGWEAGALVATFAMAGDLFSSFVKRRLHLPSSSMAIGHDHIPESLFPLLASRWLLPLNILDIVAGVTIFVAGALILSPLLFKLNLRDEPH